MQQARIPVAIIGAGPYGLSIAAHLAVARADFRIFGRPMYRWRCQMPQGMFLKSEGCASSLSDPAGDHTLANYCRDHGLSYGAWGKPVSLDLFVQYALDFQRDLVPSIEQTMVTSMERSPSGFELTLDGASGLTAAQVVIATGLEHVEHVPDELACLPRDLVTHSSQHHDLSRFHGREVIVIGGGQSAIETAALLAEEGASVRLVVRKPALAWNSAPQHGRRSAYQRMRHPASGLGIGGELWAYCRAPHLFRFLPPRVRSHKVATVLGPAGAWWLKERIDGRVQVQLSHSLRCASEKSGRIALTLECDGRATELTADHVIAATGYRFILDRLPFLNPELKRGIRLENGMPALSTSFESSVPGLYFTGLASAMSFGPSMRFIYGAEFTALRLARRLAPDRGRVSVLFPRFAPSSKCDV